jgi:hypothetical protein
LALEALLDGQASALTQKAIDLALAGDIPALRICLKAARRRLLNSIRTTDQAAINAGFPSPARGVDKRRKLKDWD